MTGQSRRSWLKRAVSAVAALMVVPSVFAQQEQESARFARELGKAVRRAFKEDN